MAKLNQAQEPSMEEILASIRRIISDDGDDGDLDGHQGSLQPAISTAAIDALFGQRPAAAAPQPPVAEEPLPSFLRGEPKSAVKAEAPVPQVLRHPEPPRHAEPLHAEQRAAEPHAEPRPAAAARPQEIRPAEPRLAEFRAAEPMRSRPEAAPRPQVAPEGVRREPVQPAPRATTDWQHEPQAAAPQPGASVRSDEPMISGRPLPMPAEQQLAAARLLSPATDAAVSASFGDLAQTLLGGQARTLEDLVKDMLRPMLKAWLDTNLPPLVERLVRDEIERVSRGR